MCCVCICGEDASKVEARQRINTPGKRIMMLMMEKMQYVFAMISISAARKGEKEGKAFDFYNRTSDEKKKLS